MKEDLKKFLDEYETIGPLKIGWEKVSEMVQKYDTELRMYSSLSAFLLCYMRENSVSKQELSKELCIDYDTLCKILKGWHYIDGKTKLKFKKFFEKIC